MDGPTPNFDDESRYVSPQRAKRPRTFALAAATFGLVLLIAALALPVLIGGPLSALAGAPPLSNAGQGKMGVAPYVAPATHTPNLQATAAAKAGKQDKAAEFDAAGKANQDANLPQGLTGASSLLANATPDASGPGSNQPGAGNADKSKAPSATPDKTQLPDPDVKISGPGVSQPSSGPRPSGPKQVNATLYNQDDNVGAGSITSQNFEPARDNLDGQTADDFVVPANTTWDITQVQAAGTMNGNGPVDSFNVFFYTNSGTLPGSPVYTMTNLPYTVGGANNDRYLITLSSPAALYDGTYWVSVQANLNRIPNGQWFWGNRSLQSNSKAAWRNAGNGFQTGCTNWGIRMNCVSSNDPDQLFTLYGNSYTGAASATPTGITPSATSTATSTATPQNTPCTRTWTIENSDNVGAQQNRLMGVSSFTAVEPAVTDIWAVGYYIDEATLHYRTLAEHWDGEGWTVVSSPNQGNGDNVLRDVTVVSPADVWAVGSYTTDNGEVHSLILHYNGVSWSITPGVPTIGTNDPSQGSLISNELNAVHHSSPTDVWAVGRYLAPDPNFSYQKRYNTLVLRYNGTSWTQVASPNPEVPGSGAISNNLEDVYALSSTDVWAVGEYRTYLGSGGLDFYWRTLAMHWNGSAWTIHNVSDPGYGNHLNGVVALSSTDVWVAGYYDGKTLIRHYDGSTWTQVNTPNPGAFTNVLTDMDAVAADDVWAVGYYEAQIPAPLGGFYYVYRPLALHWDGFSWTEKPAPSVDDSSGQPLSNYFYGVTALASDDVWAVGSYNSFTSERTLAEHYSGPCTTETATNTPTQTGTATMTSTPESMTATPTSVTPTTQPTVVPYCIPTSPNPGAKRNILRAVDFAAPDAVWAVGSYGGDVRDERTLIMKWNGLNWKTVPSPNGTTQEVNYLYDVSVISPTDIWAVGYYWNGFVGEGRYETLTLHWDGTSWSAPASPNVGFGYNYLYSVTAVSANDVWAVGQYYTTEGASENLIMHWTGGSSKWSVVYAPGLGNLQHVDHSSATDVWASGGYILHNSGSGWDFHTYGSGTRSTGYGDIEAIAPDDVWVLDFNARHWNGSTWTSYTLPQAQSPGAFYSFGTIYSVSASSTNDVWGVGYYYVFSDAGFWQETWVVRWNGTTWEQVQNPSITEQSGNLFGVAAIAPDDVWAVGDQFTGINPSKTLTVHYGHPCPAPPAVCGPDSNYLFATATATIEPGGTDIGLHCYDCVQAINFPFPITLYGQQYMSGTVSVNGNLQFNSASPLSDQSGCLPNDNFNTAIFGHWSDLDTKAQSGDGVYTSTLGTAPNRTFYIEWRTHWIGVSGDPINFEMVFREGQSDFDIVYGQVTFGGSFGIVGVQRDIGSRSTTFECEQSNSITSGLKVTFYQNANCEVTSTPTNTSTVAPASTNTPTRTVTPAGTTAPTNTSPPNTATNTPQPGVTYTPTAIKTATATTPAGCSVQFTDLTPQDTFYSYIECLACKDVLSGFPDGSFRSGANITRGQIAKIVSNAAGFNEDPGSQIYSDVPPGAPFYAYINRLTNRHIVSGYPCPTKPQEAAPGDTPCTPENPSLFRPNANATRGQLAKIVSNAAGYNEDVSGQYYADVPSSGEGSQFYTWIMRLTNRGVMSGYECGTSDTRSGPCDSHNRPYFRPANAVTRGQSAKIVANTFFPNCQVSDR